MDIKNVAIYLRKSREDELDKNGDVLKHHQILLVDLCEKHNYDYKIYHEVLSGESLSSRPQMIQLLDDVSASIYDAVVCMDIDRLTRGGDQDSGYIKSTIRDSGVYIIDKNHKIYDLENDVDDTMYSFKSFFAYEELKIIKRRFHGGKEARTRDGRWANGGQPPYPYKYNRETKKIEVDEDKRPVYNYIKNTFLDGKLGIKNITQNLNKKGIASPKGMPSGWITTTVHRILLSEFHAGIVIYGKAKYRTKNGKSILIHKITDRSKQCRGIGKHEILKTPEEHEKILKILEQRRVIPYRSRSGMYPTAGLLYCSKCGRRMRYCAGKKSKKTGLTYDYCKCGNRRETKIQCPQVGCKMDEKFYSTLFNAIVKSYISVPKIEEIEKNKKVNSVDALILTEKQNTLLNTTNQLARAKDAYLKNIDTLEEYSENKKRLKLAIDRLHDEIIALEKDKKLLTPAFTAEEIEKRVGNFKDSWSTTLTPQEQHQLLGSIVKRIEYDRCGDTVTFKIEYL